MYCIRESHSNAATVCPPLVEELGLFLSRFISELGVEEKRKNNHMYHRTTLVFGLQIFKNFKVSYYYFAF